MRIARILLPISILVSLAATNNLAAKSQWYSGKSANFEYLSNANEKLSKKTILEFEEFREALLALFPQLRNSLRKPPFIYIFRTNKIFKRYKKIIEGKPQNASGFFVNRPNQAIIALHLEGNFDMTRDRIYHEFIHYLFKDDPKLRPVWFEEGFAEYYSTIRIVKGRIEIGRADPGSVHLLQNMGIIPMQDFFRVTKSSPYYKESLKQGQFYAQSWAFIHYCLLSNNLRYANAFSVFTDQLDLNSDIDTVFEKSFGFDIDDMETQIRKYVYSGKYQMIYIPFDDSIVDRKFSINKARDAEIEFYLGDLLLIANRGAESKLRLEKAKVLLPDWAKPYEALGILALRNKQWNQAKDFLFEAESRKSKNAQVYYHLTTLDLGLTDKVLFYNSRLTGDQESRVIRRLVTAISLDPYFREQYTILTNVLIESEKKFGEKSLQFLHRGLILYPGDSELAFKIAKLEIRSGFVDQAQETLAPFLGEENEEHIRTGARKILGDL